MTVRKDDHHNGRPIVTTSWDDGHARDTDVAELLANHGLRGTFYLVARAYEHDRGLGNVDVDRLLSLNMEIGAHTLTHPDLTAVDETTGRQEVVGSRQILAERTGRPITSFCYPYGRFNRRVRTWVEDAGFRLARTTVAFRSPGRDHLAFPVSMQAFPHTRSVHARHALKERNVRGLARWATRYGRNTSLVGLGRRMLDDVLYRGGVLHIWGHSWEIEEYGLWPQFRELLADVSGHPGVDYLTNEQTLEAISGADASLRDARGRRSHDAS